MIRQEVTLGIGGTVRNTMFSCSTELEVSAIIQSSCHKPLSNLREWLTFVPERSSGVAVQTCALSHGPCHQVDGQLEFSLHLVGWGMVPRQERSLRPF